MVAATPKQKESNRWDDETKDHKQDHKREKQDEREERYELKESDEWPRIRQMERMKFNEWDSCDEWDEDKEEHQRQHIGPNQLPWATAIGGFWSLKWA